MLGYGIEPFDDLLYFLFVRQRLQPGRLLGAPQQDVEAEGEVIAGGEGADAVELLPVEGVAGAFHAAPLAGVLGGDLVEVVFEVFGLVTAVHRADELVLTGRDGSLGTVHREGIHAGRSIRSEHFGVVEVVGRLAEAQIHGDPR